MSELRSGSVQQQSNFEGRLGGGEITHLLRLAIFKDRKVLGAQICDRMAASISDDRRYADKLRLNAHHVAFADFFRR